jgi:hypothetical protein
MTLGTPTEGSPGSGPRRSGRRGQPVNMKEPESGYGSISPTKIVLLVPQRINGARIVPSLMF